VGYFILKYLLAYLNPQKPEHNSGTEGWLGRFKVVLIAMLLYLTPRMAQDACILTE
jgi:hypothetical protein